MDSDLVLELAHAEGFDLAGFAPLAPPPAAERFEDWLEAGHHGSMEYLARNRERILDPRRILPEGKTLLVLGLGHSRPAHQGPGGERIARYALGRDYHNLIGKKLKRLTRRLREEGLVDRSRSIVDAGPLLERSHASVAGLGFESKAANLLHPSFGPWFFLAEVLLDGEFETGRSAADPARPGNGSANAASIPESPGITGSCGTCTACLDECPTAAILEPGVVDARRCISYQTIENRGPIPHELRAAMGGWVFGCDVCSEVCPWGGKAPDLGARFGLHPAVEEGSPILWVQGDWRGGLRKAGADPNASQGTAPFDQALEGSPLRRPKREGLARNSAIVLGNLPSDAGRSALLHALSFDPAGLVREAAAWGLARGHGDEPSTREALDQALQRELDPGARDGMARTLEEMG